MRLRSVPPLCRMRPRGLCSVRRPPFCHSPSLPPPSPSLPSSGSLSPSSSSSPTLSSSLSSSLSPPPSSSLASLSSLPSLYLELSKSRLSALVVLTTGAGHLMAQPNLDPALLTATLAGTYLCAASANTFNQVIEIPRDAQMARTARRPLPSGRMSREHALAFATTAGLTGVGSLALLVNPTTAALGAATIALYAGVYTPLKPRTPYNTWVGAVVGAVPPLMGWSAAGAPLLTPEAFVLSSALFLWQIPHFLALAWMYRADYAAGGYAMMPLRDPTGSRTSAVCLEYSAYLALLPVGCWAAGLTTCMFPIESILFNGAMLTAAARFHNAPPNQRSLQTTHARRLFFVSLAYLPFFFFCLLLHQRDRVKNELSESVVHSTTMPDASLAYPPFSDETDASGTGEPLSEAREALRRRGRRLCIHERMDSHSSLCPVIAADAVVDQVSGVVEVASSGVKNATAGAAATGGR